MLTTNNFIGIDPSLTATGICVLNRQSKIIHTAELKSNLKSGERIYYILDSIRKTIENFEVTHAAIEGFAFGAYGSAIFSLGELSGCIKMLLDRECDWQVKRVTVQPTTLKKFLTDKGNCNKDLILLSVYKNFGLEFTSHNIADAFGLAKICYHVFCNARLQLSKSQDLIISNLKKNENLTLF